MHPQPVQKLYKAVSLDHWSLKRASIVRMADISSQGDKLRCMLQVGELSSNQGDSLLAGDSAVGHISGGGRAHEGVPHLRPGRLPAHMVCRAQTHGLPGQPSWDLLIDPWCRKNT